MTTLSAGSWIDDISTKQSVLLLQQLKPSYAATASLSIVTRQGDSLIVHPSVLQFRRSLAVVWSKMEQVLDNDELPPDFKLEPLSRRKIQVRIKSVKIAKFRFIDDEDIDFSQLDEW